jgi:hypothetical protein
MSFLGYRNGATEHRQDGARLREVSLKPSVSFYKIVDTKEEELVGR